MEKKIQKVLKNKISRYMSVRMVCNRDVDNRKVIDLCEIGYKRIKQNEIYV